MPALVSSPRTLYDKIWDDHLVLVLNVFFIFSCAHLLDRDVKEDGLALIYIDR
jgi:hypothetical protein